MRSRSGQHVHHTRLEIGIVDRRIVPWCAGRRSRGCGAGHVLAAVRGLWSPYACITAVHQRIAGLSGFDFEISETDCDFLAKEAATSVFVSEVGQKKKTLLFKYVPTGYDAIPSITPVDEHTVQISIRRVPQILCRKERWQTLAIRYVIGIVEYPHRNGEPDEC